MPVIFFLTFLTTTGIKTREIGLLFFFFKIEVVICGAWNLKETQLMK